MDEFESKWKNFISIGNPTGQDKNMYFHTFLCRRRYAMGLIKVILF
jgi:hypothetical protein